MRSVCAYAALVGLLVACDREAPSRRGSSSVAALSDSAAALASSDARCPRCAAPETSGVLGDDAIGELSGIVASSKEPGVFFVHNDSGDEPRFFAIDPKGALLATFKVTGAKAVDWEDIARGPCAPGAAESCLYLADIGDNRESRSEYAIYRAVEPEVRPMGAPSASKSIAADAIAFVYPDGSHDAETILVHPTTGVITLVTKMKAGPSSIYELPPSAGAGRTLTAVKAGEVTPPVGINLITGGDVDPRATSVLLRTYTNVFYYPIVPAQSVARALAGPPCITPGPIETQGEAIAFLPTGDGYVTGSEGKRTAIQSVRCERLAPSSRPR